MCLNKRNEIDSLGEKGKPGLKPCPFCGSSKVSLFATTDVLTHVVCENEDCMAAGPLADRRPHAEALWNLALRPVATEPVAPRLNSIGHEWS